MKSAFEQKAVLTTRREITTSPISLPRMHLLWASGDSVAEDI